MNTKVAGMKASDIGHLAYTAEWSNDEGIDVGVRSSVCSWRTARG